MWRPPTDRYFNMDSAGRATELGSTFTFDFGQSGLKLDSKSVTLAIVRGTFWWTIPNIQDSWIEMKFPASGELYPDLQVLIPIPTGLYTYSLLNDRIYTALKLFQVDYEDFPTAAVRIQADLSTQTLAFDCSVPVSIRLISRSTRQENALAYVLGFPISDETVYTVDEPGLISAPDYARFDSVQFLQVASQDLCDTGIVQNDGTSRGVMAQITISVPPGAQITYDPSNPLEIPTSVFSGSRPKAQARLALLDHNGQSVNTNGQSWSVLLRVRSYD
jgi:hypothetical protein